MFISSASKVTTEKGLYLEDDGERNHYLENRGLQKSKALFYLFYINYPLGNQIVDEGKCLFKIAFQLISEKMKW